ncbi:unnamed protein product [Amoebophrya sp. A25]|nr:unnamed protein product [Amoebophrya sp. A25]|eukprot:GSA25T00025578001.1
MSTLSTKMTRTTMAIIMFQSSNVLQCLTRSSLETSLSEETSKKGSRTCWLTEAGPWGGGVGVGRTPREGAEEKGHGNQAGETAKSLHGDETRAERDETVVVPGVSFLSETAWEFERCWKHKLDHEWNYFHMFERNLLRIFSAIQHGQQEHEVNKVATAMLQQQQQQHGNNTEETWGSPLLGIRQATMKARTNAPRVIILDGAQNVNILKGWLNVLFSEDAALPFAGMPMRYFITRKSKSNAGRAACCSQVESSSTLPGSWREVAPHLREFMYRKAALFSLASSKEVALLTTHQEPAVRYDHLRRNDDEEHDKNTAISHKPERREIDEAIESEQQAKIELTKTFVDQNENVRSISTQDLHENDQKRGRGAGPAGRSGMEKTGQFCFFNRNATAMGHRGRSFTNLNELVGFVRAATSLEPVLLEFEAMAPLEQVRAVSKCDVAIGIHGAGLTNFLWLHPGALAIQICPFQSSSAFQRTYQEVAEAAALQYREWAPSSYKQVRIHWEQMQDSKTVLAAVCKCGVRELLAHGTKGACGDDFLNWAFYVNQDIQLPVADLQQLLPEKMKLVPAAHTVVQKETEISRTSSNKNSFKSQAQYQNNFYEKNTSSSASSSRQEEKKLLRVELDATGGTSVDQVGQLLQNESSARQTAAQTTDRIQEKLFFQRLSQQLAAYATKIRKVIERFRRLGPEEAEKLCAAADR